MDAIEHYDAVDVFIGVDVGKGEHHAVALDRSGKRLFNKALANDEGRLRALTSGLKEHGQLLLVVDQPATIGAPPITVARAEGILASVPTTPSAASMTVTLPCERCLKKAFSESRECGCVGTVG